MQHVSPIHDENQSPINSFIESPAISYYSTFATTPPAQERLQMALLEKQALLEELSRARKRERQLLSEHKRAAAQLQEARALAQQAQEASHEMLAARRSAREALSDMAQQNGRLITALMDAKRQLTAMRDAHAATQRQYEYRIEGLEQQVCALQPSTSTCGVQTDPQLMMPVDSLHTRETCGHTNPPCCASSAQYSHHDDDDDGVREVVHGEENATHPLEGPTTAPHHNDANDTTNGNDTTNDNDNNSSTSPCSSSSIPIHTTNNNTPAAGDASLHTTATAPPAASDHVLIQTLEEENKRLQAQVTRLQQLVESAALHEQQSEARQQAEQHKQAGNNAFHQQQYTQAIQHYEAALALSIDDPRLAAVLHCNKAAALHEQGHYIEAVVQCCIAESYDGGYSRVYQRRAEAYSSLGDYTAALRDMQVVAKTVKSADVSRRVSQLQRKTSRQGPVNYYAVLGVPSNAPVADIKAAYRALALRFHPDKATEPRGQAACAAVFRVAAEANAVLTDVVKRAAYDALVVKTKLRASSR